LAALIRSKFFQILSDYVGLQESPPAFLDGIETLAAEVDGEYEDSTLFSQSSRRSVEVGCIRTQPMNA